MSLNSDQIRQFKSLAHHLKPVILVGQKGLSENVFNEINIALDVHELIKIKIATEDRDEFRDMAQQICDQTTAELIQTIGRTVVVYRKKPEEK